MRAHGHTGWSSPAVYAYDQAARLAVVDAVVPAVSDDRHRALDFGCGTGDFSRLLLARGWTVWAYDPFVRPVLTHPRFHVLSTPEQLREAGPFDLLLSVTVLDHVLDETEFCDVLAKLRATCSRTGQLILVEYALDKPGQTAPYQAFRTLTTWRSKLDETGWDLERVDPLPHPEDAPTPGFLRFRRRWSIRLLTQLARRGPIAAPARAMLNELGRRSLLIDGASTVCPSPLKLMVARPRSEPARVPTCSLEPTQ